MSSAEAARTVTTEEWAPPAHVIHRHPAFATRRGELDQLHVKVLAAVPRRGAALDPVLLWQGPRGRLTLLDGAHRLAAYGVAKWSGGIPARIVTCDRRTALLTAAEANSRDAKPLTNPEKADLAWRFVRDADAAFTKLEIVKATGISNGTVGTMRARWATMRELGVEPQGSWWRDRRGGSDWSGSDEPLTDDERTRVVAERAKAVLKALNPLQRQDSELVGDILAAALGRQFREIAEYHFGLDGEEDDDEAPF